MIICSFIHPDHLDTETLNHQVSLSKGKQSQRTHKAKVPIKYTGAYASLQERLLCWEPCAFAPKSLHKEHCLCKKAPPTVQCFAYD